MVLILSPSTAVIIAVVSAWSFLLTTMDRWRLQSQTLARVSELYGSVSEGNKSKEGFSHIQGLKGKILNQVRDLSVEAGGKGSAKKDLNNQRNLFKDVLEFLEVLILFIFISMNIWFLGLLMLTIIHLVMLVRLFSRDINEDWWGSTADINMVSVDSGYSSSSNSPIYVCYMP